MESNDTLLTATQTSIDAGTIGEFTFSGTIGDNPDIGSADDVDLFELEISEDTGIFFDINAEEVGSSLDPVLRVFDADGNELAVNDDATGLDSFIGFSPPSTGNYFVGVSGFSNFGYNPTVAGSTADSNSTGDYDLVITVSDEIIEETKDLAGGAQLLVDISPGFSYGSPDSSYASSLTNFNGQLFFSANDGENGNELWVSDGTAEGTQLLVDINPGSSYGSPDGSYASNFFDFNGQLFFSADDGENGEELWVSDGTAEGTQLLVDINPGESYSSNAANFTEFNGQFFFSANGGENGNELWVSDGTEEGTQLLLDINPGSYFGYYGDEYIASSNAANFTEFNGQLFFTANDGESGNELWVSDGTAAGTQLLIDINPGGFSGTYNYFPNNSNASSFTEFNGQLFFTANDGENGDELWVSDGTSAGTQLLIDINPGISNYGVPYSSYARDLTVADDLLFFTANDPDINAGPLNGGRELWVSDGTAEGTQLFQDINPGSDGSNPGDLSVFGDQLFFTANDGTTGDELWVATIPDNIISGDEDNNRLVGTADIDLINGFEGNDRLIGRAGGDVINGGSGRDNISGNRGADLLTGGAGNDRIVSGAGDDTLIGGTGDDILTGARGADIFVFEADLLDGQSDTDRIRNFRSEDLLDFTDYLGAGGSIESTRVNSSLLSLDLGDEDIVNIAGNQSGLDAAELQLEALT